MSEGGEVISSTMAWRFLRLASRLALRRKVGLSVTGLDHVPTSGPALIAARHYHHLYDGCALLISVPRPAQILVTADWARRRPVRRLLERACAFAGWPVVLRADVARYRPDFQSPPDDQAYQREVRRYLRGAINESVDRLRDGQVLVMFPEGYPTVDPHFTTKSSDQEMLPFQQGVARLVALAQRNTGVTVPVIPAGFTYVKRSKGRWRISLRLGPPLIYHQGEDRVAFLRLIERQVAALSDMVIQ